MDRYDLIVIGTGTAAQVTAARVMRAGRLVAMIDHRPFGGTCALRGCDPKKMLVSGAEAVDWARRMHRRGIVGELRQVSATGIVKRIHFLRIADERLGRGKLHRIEPCPDAGSTLVAECTKAALRGNARAGD